MSYAYRKVSIFVPKAKRFLRQHAMAGRELQRERLVGLYSKERAATQLRLRRAPGRARVLGSPVTPVIILRS